MSFDPAKLIAAAKAAAQAKPVPIKLAGIGDAFIRKMTIADLEAASDICDRVEKNSKLGRNTINIAATLCLRICGPEGEPVFDPANDEHILMLANSVPIDSLGGAMGGAGKD
jgi:hypothetical protein